MGERDDVLVLVCMGVAGMLARCSADGARLHSILLEM